MPKFGQDLFNGGRYGTYTRQWIPFKKTIRGVILGSGIRKQLGKRIIFRVRRGNGYFGSTAGVLYQDKYTYFVPSSINHVNGQGAREALTTAVSDWHYVLTDAQKAEYNRRAKKGLRMSGFNLYIKEYIEVNV